MKSNTKCIINPENSLKNQNVKWIKNLSSSRRKEEESTEKKLYLLLFIFAWKIFEKCKQNAFPFKFTTPFIINNNKPCSVSMYTYWKKNVGETIKL